MSLPTLYNQPGTTVVGVRISRATRAHLEALAASNGVTLSVYVRTMVENHLRAEGFELTPGHDAVVDPLRDTPEGWIRDHTERGERVCPRAPRT